MRTSHAVSLALALGLVAPTAGRAAVQLPVLEDFPTNVRNWVNTANAPLTFEATGGPDDGSYATTELNYFGFTNPFGGGPVLFRAHDDNNASADQFVGNWNNAGVGLVRAWVRQDTGEELVYFLRVATAFNFPGAVIDDDVAVPSGVWTQIEIEIDPDDPACQGEGVTCAEALANVGNFQIGTNPTEDLVLVDAAFDHDIDKVELLEAPVPEPGQALLAAVGGLVLAAARRGRRGSPRSAARR